MCREVCLPDTVMAVMLSAPVSVLTLRSTFGQRSCGKWVLTSGSGQVRCLVLVMGKPSGAHRSNTDAIPHPCGSFAFKTRMGYAFFGADDCARSAWPVGEYSTSRAMASPLSSANRMLFLGSWTLLLSISLVSLSGHCMRSSYLSLPISAAVFVLRGLARGS